MNQDIFQSKLLIISVIFLFILLISSDVLPQRNVSAENDIEKLIQEGEELYKNGEYREAIVKFLEAKDLARTREEISEVYFNLSSAYYAINQSAEAKEHLQKSLEILPERTIDALYYSPGFVEMFNKTKAESIKLEEKRPVVKVKPGEEKKVKKGGKGFLYVIGALVVGGGVAAALLLGKKATGETTGSGSIQAITVIELPHGTVWTTGEEVEIKWETSGSGSSQGVASTGAGLNPLINQGRRALSRFQRRAFQERRFLRSVIKERRKLEDVDSSGSRGKLSSKTSKPQGVLGEISSSAKEGDIVHKRAKDTGNIKRKSIVGRVNIPVAPQISNDKFMLSGNIRVLGLSYVKIDLYKGGTLKQTIAESTENDGSYLWTVDPSLEDGTDYKVRISSTSDSTVYGESEEFTIREMIIGTYTVSGRVYYSTTPLDGVTVELLHVVEETLLQSTTTSNGYYYFFSVDPGSYHIKIYGPTDEYALAIGIDINVIASNVTQDMYLPKKITLLSPADNSTVSSLHPTLSWEANSEAFKYGIQINVTEGWQLVELVSDISSTNYAVQTELTSGVNYTWMVWAYDAYNHVVGQSSPNFRFTVSSGYEFINK